MKKIIKLYFVIILIFFTMYNITSLAHKGRTDSSGGHYDRSTGEYHYHHGYSAHQHINGICPYDYDDKTEHSFTLTAQNKTNSSTALNIVNSIATSNVFKNTYNNYSTVNNTKEKTSHNFVFLAFIFLFIICPFLEFMYELIIKLVDWIKNKLNIKKQNNNIKTEDKTSSNTIDKNNTETNTLDSKPSIVKKYYNKYYTCPKCGGLLILKNDKYGYFYRL